MEKSGPLSEKQVKLISNILVCGKHLLEMVNDILDLAKIEAGKIEINKKPFRVEQLLTRSISSIKALALEKSIKIKYNADSELGWINADEVRIKQVMYNLLSNAIKFTGTGKSIGIDTTALGDEIVITVWDEGIGIPEEYLEKIFEPFEQVVSDGVEKQSGTGLGLSITRKLVEMHDGSINGKSIPGRGSFFVVTLPGRIDFSEITEENKGDAGLQSHYYHGGKSRILVVEDNRLNIDVLKNMLENSPWDVDYVLTGEKALEQVYEKVYDIILMDIQLPGMDGIEVMKRIKRDKKIESKIIALTAYAMKGDWEKFINEGFDDYISKPVDISSLFVKIRNHLIEKRGGYS
jgi:CheY-like chemotaxis protein/anti-sigma regulatory factor (Ser/Thr protein kinase)